MILLLATAIAHASCRAPVGVAEPHGAEAPEEGCVFVDLDVGGRAFQGYPDVGLSRGFALVRSRVELGVRTAADLQVRVAVAGARSAGSDGYVGIAGEAWVPVLQIAEARYDLRDAGLAVGAGLVDDLWTMTTQPAWGLRALAAPLATDSGLFERSDEGLWVGYTSVDGRASVSAALQAGEGANLRERNEGLDLSLLGTVRPFPTDRLTLAAHVRQGTRGLAAARDHRAAGAVIFRDPRLVAAVEGALGWGLGGDAELQPAAASAWLRAGPELPAVAWLRGDVRWADRDTASSREVALRVGGGPRLPFGEGPGYVVAGVEVRRYEPDAAPLAGTEAVSGTETLFLQVGANLAGGLPL